MITNGRLLICHNILFAFKIRGACGDFINVLNQQTSKQISTWCTLILGLIKLINFRESLNSVSLQLSLFDAWQSRESEIGSKLLI